MKITKDTTIGDLIEYCECIGCDKCDIEEVCKELFRGAAMYDLNKLIGEEI